MIYDINGIVSSKLFTVLALTFYTSSYSHIVVDPSSRKETCDMFLNKHVHMADFHECLFSKTRDHLLDQILLESWIFEGAEFQCLLLVLVCVNEDTDTLW